MDIIAQPMPPWSDFTLSQPVRVDKKGSKIKAVIHSYAGENSFAQDCYHVQYPDGVIEKIVSYRINKESI